MSKVNVIKANADEIIFNDIKGNEWKVEKMGLGNVRVTMPNNTGRHIQWQISQDGSRISTSYNGQTGNVYVTFVDANPNFHSSNTLHYFVG